MGVDTGVSWGASQVLVFSIWYMGICFRITETLCQTKVDHVDLIAALADAHQEIIWLDITMNESYSECKQSRGTDE